MKKVVFTNGCFDIIHSGHIKLLKEAKSKGTHLVVGINSDESVRSIKGFERPLINEDERKLLLKSIKYVDEVIIFSEPTPERLVKEVKPDVLVKGGDWKESEIIGADFVKSIGGNVYSIPLKQGYSTTNIVNKIFNMQKSSSLNESVDESKNLSIEAIKKHKVTVDKLLQEQVLNIDKCAEILVDTLKSNKKILICGNGGSAADSQHIAAELVGRYIKERKALPAIALTTDTSSLTAITNDYDFARVFSRQVEALAKEGDTLIAISTSGESENVINAVMSAREIGCKVVSLTGKNGKKLASLSDSTVLVPSIETPRIQECHLLTIHIWCELIDANF